MDAKLIPTDINEKMDDANDTSRVLLSSITTTSQSPSIQDNYAESQTDTDVPGEVKLHDTLKGGAAGAVPVCSRSTVGKEQPNTQLCALLPSSSEACTEYEVTPSFTSISKMEDSLKPTKGNTEPDGDDLCAAILLACLFCHPLDCLWATVRGCNQCLWSLCSCLWCCEPSSLPSVPDINRLCDLCGCLGVRCCLCDCPMCDICLQATECLDLAMEISQMLYH